MALTLDGTNGIVSSGSITTQSATGVIFSDSSALTAASSPFVLKNRIINGDMRIDQRNAGASSNVTTTQVYNVDRWWTYGSQTSKLTVQQSSTAPVGFNNSIVVTSLSSYSVLSSDIFQLAQRIEGYNCADLGWGTSDAKTITVSFWVRSSLTGTFSGSISNSINRAYCFNYTIISANTWEQKTITVPGDTTGTWEKTNFASINVSFNMGQGSTYNGTLNTWTATNTYGTSGSTNIVGTNGATFYLTGVQLEVGSTATPFERRMIGTELALCQRYFYQLGGALNGYMYGVGMYWTATSANFIFPMPVTMRTSPNFNFVNGGNLVMYYNSASSLAVSNITLDIPSPQTVGVYTVNASGGSTGNAVRLNNNTATNSLLQFSAEL